jgi:hypothetical protein
MAIKIIKEGKKKIAVYKETCTLCDCEFEYNFEDVEHSFKGWDENFFRLTCPCCKKTINTSKINPIRYDLID